MRILFVIDTLGAGGAERSLQEMVPLFVREGVKPVIACFHRRAEGVEHLVLGQADVRVLSGLSRAGQVEALRRIIRDERIELVHTTLFEADVLGRIATAGTRARVVTSLVNMPYEPSRLEHDRNVDTARLLAARFLEATTGALFADHFHAITFAVKAAAGRYFGIAAEKITVVPRGRDGERLGRRSEERRERAREALGIPDEANVVLTAGRQEFQKGQRFLVQAMHRLVATRPETVLLVAGRSGSATRELSEEAAHPALEGRVRFLGHRDDLPELLSAADVFALPSLWEGLGGVLIEAMALELPIVASDIVAIREATDQGRAAVLVRPEDPASLAGAIQALSSDAAARARLAREGRALFESRYTLEQSARGMMGIFEQVMRAPRGARRLWRPRA